MDTRTRKAGNSIIITLPLSKEHNIEVGKDYNVIYDDNGTIHLVPKLGNPFIGVKLGEFYEDDIWENIPDVGNEIIE
jgi:hypothetical protein